MNNVIVKYHFNNNPAPQKGDIYYSHDSRHFYMVVYVNGYVIVDLHEGHWNHCPLPDLTQLHKKINGSPFKFQFVGRDLQIALSRSAPE
jgi:hypothetical protein